MPGEPVAPSPKTRPVTRGSIRHSLNLASVSKAFADVINKDKDTTKVSKRSKDSRRPSAVNLSKPSVPRPSMAEAPSPSQPFVRTGTPDSKIITRRRVSATMQRASSDEQTSKSGDSGNNTPTGLLSRASLRTRNPNTSASSLPKYRPKSATEQKPPSPVAARAGTRRRFRSSDDEKEDRRKPEPPSTSMDKVVRPISPLPQRAALKTLNTTSAPPTPTKLHTDTHSSNRGTPTRPAKTSKIMTTTTSTVPRPPSSSSTSSIATHSPKTPVVKSGLRRATQNSQRSTTTIPDPESPSPAARHARTFSKADSPVRANMSHISEAADEDTEDEADVELLLAPIARVGAPTPAMPRIKKTRVPKTPKRGPSQLPTRANMSYLSPPPPSDGGPALPRPQQPRPSETGARNFGRGSILSWEQLASEASKTLGEDEIENMLADIPAPFRSGAASPAMSATLEVPESPCLSALDSPSGYGSISQVLLPDVTPSPALHASQRYSLSPSDRSSVDSPMITLLRLQLAQAESIGKDRLMQMQAMEEEIHNIKEVHAHQMEETTRRLTYLEARGRQGEEQRTYVSSLENQLRQTEAQCERVVRDAVRKSEESLRSWEMKSQRAELTVEAKCAARLASSEWMSVKGVSEVELDLVKGDRAVLSILLADLDQMTRLLSF